MANLKTVAQFSADSGFTEAQIRWWIFNGQTNGLEGSGALLRIGRRVYIDSQLIDRWVRSQPETVGAGEPREPRLKTIPLPPPRMPQMEDLEQVQALILTAIGNVRSKDFEAAMRTLRDASSAVSKAISATHTEAR